MIAQHLSPCQLSEALRKSGVPTAYTDLQNHRPHPLAHQRGSGVLTAWQKVATPYPQSIPNEASFHTDCLAAHGALSLEAVRTPLLHWVVTTLEGTPLREEQHPLSPSGEAVSPPLRTPTGKRCPHRLSERDNSSSPLSPPRVTRTGSPASGPRWTACACGRQGPSSRRPDTSRAPAPSRTSPRHRRACRPSCTGRAPRSRS